MGKILWRSVDWRVFSTARFLGSRDSQSRLFEIRLHPGGIPSSFTVSHIGSWGPIRSLIACTDHFTCRMDHLSGINCHIFWTICLNGIYCDNLNDLYNPYIFPHHVRLLCASFTQASPGLIRKSWHGRILIGLTCESYVTVFAGRDHECMWIREPLCFVLWSIIQCTHLMTVWSIDCQHISRGNRYHGSKISALKSWQAGRGDLPLPMERHIPKLRTLVLSIYVIN